MEDTVTCWHCHGAECEDCDWSGAWPYAVSEADIHPSQRDGGEAPCPER